MNVIRRVFGWLFKAFAAFVILIFLFVSTMIFLSRQERALAKEFVLLVGQGRYADAHDIFSDELKQEYPVELMKSQFGRSQDYTKVSFHGIKWQNGQMILIGRAATEGGCKSPVEFYFLDEVITAFRVGNLCLTEEKSA
jgi:hypothetical protein